MLGAPYHYRDERTVRGVADVHARIDGDELYRRNGLQHLPFNTLFQFAAERDVLALADQALLVPDLISYWLTGVAATEITNASTTGLLSPHTRAWDEDLLTRLDLPREILAPLIEPGTRLGTPCPPSPPTSAHRKPGRRRRRLPRHGLRRRRGALDGRSRGVHLERNLVARRRRAREAGGLAGGSDRRLHQRGRRRRACPLPEERVGTLAPVRVDPDLGEADRRADRAAAPPRRGRRDPRPRHHLRRGRRALRRTGEHPRPDRGVVRRARGRSAPLPRGVRALDPRVPRGGLRHDPPAGVRALGHTDRHRAHRGRRIAERAALPADRRPHRPHRARRSGRGDRDRQHPRPGPRSGPRAQIPRIAPLPRAPGLPAGPLRPPPHLLPEKG